MNEIIILFVIFGLALIAESTLDLWRAKRGQRYRILRHGKQAEWRVTPPQRPRPASRRAKAR
jgi:hypothetical protein